MDIYLDQNHFIALARVYHGRQTHPAVAHASSLIRGSISAGRLTLPLSRQHLLEATKIGDAARRKRLIEAFISLSRGWVIKPTESLTSEELLKWERGEIPRAGTAIRRGLLSAFTTYEFAAGNLRLYPTEISEADNIGDDPDAWSFALTRPWFRQQAATVDAQADAYAKRVESVRAAWWSRPPIRRKEVYAEGLLQDTIASLQPPTPQLHKALLKLEQTPVDELPARLAEISTLDVLMVLGEAKTKDMSRRTDPNDLWDLAFLATVIPYFDLVVTEKYWAHLATTTGIARKYSCQVLAKIEDVSDFLA